MYKDKESNMSRIFFVNVWRKNTFDIYVTEYGTALTTILPILFLYLNTVIGKFEHAKSGNPKSCIEERPTIQFWPKVKDRQWSTTHYSQIKDWRTRTQPNVSCCLCLLQLTLAEIISLSWLHTPEFNRCMTSLVNTMLNTNSAV